MRVTYYALKPIQVGEDWRQPGDLIPEANEWRYLPFYLSDGSIAPVLVATLPQEAQDLLREWERQQTGDLPESSPEDDGAGEDKGEQPEAKPPSPADKGKTPEKEKKS